MSLPCPTRLTFGIPIGSGKRASWRDNAVTALVLLVAVPMMIVLELMGRLK